ncbi:hypothetical protein R1sor_025114 [Riccia sorocarpa]|uniref:Uncharacterized protein n=1 Tax=Riccia sorocarpa TaxID=122646 RepID=A0ABD3G970_9MARC
MPRRSQRVKRKRNGNNWDFAPSYDPESAPNLAPVIEPLLEDEGVEDGPTFRRRRYRDGVAVRVVATSEERTMGVTEKQTLDPDSPVYEVTTWADWNDQSGPEYSLETESPKNVAVSYSPQYECMNGKCGMEIEVPADSAGHF